MPSGTPRASRWVAEMAENFSLEMACYFTRRSAGFLALAAGDALRELDAMMAAARPNGRPSLAATLEATALKPGWALLMVDLNKHQQSRAASRIWRPTFLAARPRLAADDVSPAFVAVLRVVFAGFPAELTLAGLHPGELPAALPGKFRWCLAAGATPAFRFR